MGDERMPTVEITGVRHRPERRVFADHIRKTKRVIILWDVDEEIVTVTPGQPAKSCGRPSTLEEVSLRNRVYIHSVETVIQWSVAYASPV